MQSLKIGHYFLHSSKKTTKKNRSQKKEPTIIKLVLTETEKIMFNTNNVFLYCKDLASGLLQLSHILCTLTVTSEAYMNIFLCTQSSEWLTLMLVTYTKCTNNATLISLLLILK